MLFEKNKFPHFFKLKLIALCTIVSHSMKISIGELRHLYYLVGKTSIITKFICLFNLLRLFPVFNYLLILILLAKFKIPAHI